MTEAAGSGTAPSAPLAPDPALEDLFVYDGSGVRPGRTWVIAPDRVSLERRWEALRSEADAGKKEALFHPHLRGGKPGDKHVQKGLQQGLHGHEFRSGPVALDTRAVVRPVRYGHRSSNGSGSFSNSGERSSGSTAAANSSPTLSRVAIRGQVEAPDTLQRSTYRREVWDSTWSGGHGLKQPACFHEFMDLYVEAGMSRAWRRAAVREPRSPFFGRQRAVRAAAGAARVHFLEDSP